MDRQSQGPVSAKLLPILMLAEGESLNKTNEEDCLATGPTTIATGSGKPVKNEGYWKAPEIKRFELGLRMVATDFTCLEGLLPDGRNRKQLAEKFSFYEKRIQNFLHLILRHSIPFDPEQLKKGVNPSVTTRIIEEETTTTSEGKRTTPDECDAGVMSSKVRKKPRTPRKTKSSAKEIVVCGGNVPAIVQHPVLKPIINNVVANANLNCKVDLKQIYLKLRASEVESKLTPRVIVKLPKPHATVMIFPSGKMNCLGASSVEDSINALRTCSRIVQLCGSPTADLKSSYRVSNICASCSFNSNIMLKTFASKYAMNENGQITIESERFPALKFKMFQPKVTMKMFPTGNVTLSGAKSQEDVKEAFAKLLEMIQVANLFKK